MCCVVLQVFLFYITIVVEGGVLNDVCVLYLAWLPELVIYPPCSPFYVNIIYMLCSTPSIFTLLRVHFHLQIFFLPFQCLEKQIR